MFDVGWQELALTGVVALVVLGPKELPGLMRTAGKMMRKARQVANEFRLSLDELADEAELEEFRKHARKFANEKEPVLEEEELEDRAIAAPVQTPVTSSKPQEQKPEEPKNV